MNTLLGLIAAFCASAAFGSYGVTCKSKASMSVDVDPLVFQTYKTTMVFLTSWLVLLGGVDFTFSPWGIVSAAFWVPGGVATIYAIKEAGLAIGIGVGSCFIILVSFIWGVFIFQEHVHSYIGAWLAIIFLMAGLCGMAYYSSPESISTEDTAAVTEESIQFAINATLPVSYSSISVIDAESGMIATEEERQYQSTKQLSSMTGATGSVQTPLTAVGSRDDADTISEVASQATQEVEPVRYEEIFGTKVSKRICGIVAAAVVNGLWGGSILVPMKWAPPNAKGVSFLISFGIGAGVITAFFWLVRFLCNARYYQSYQKSYDNLPKFHFHVMWKPGCLGGLLWATGNAFSMEAVHNLGEGVGYPLVQTAILVSGLWGIFYYKEITGVRRISLWFASAVLAICGILLLSYQHIAK